MTVSYNLTSPISLIMTEPESSQKFLAILISYFNDCGWPCEVDEKKLRSRYSISSIGSDPNIKKLRIERHRATLGDQYRQGLPMEVYQTYWMTYLINSLTGEVEDLGEQEGEYKIDVSGLVMKQLDYEQFCLQIEHLDNGEYQVSECVSRNKINAVSIDDSYKLITNIMPNYMSYLELQLDTIEFMSPLEKDNFLSKYKGELKAQITNKLKDLWESREKDIDMSYL